MEGVGKEKREGISREALAQYVRARYLGEGELPAELAEKSEEEVVGLIEAAGAGRPIEAKEIENPDVDAKLLANARNREIVEMLMMPEA